MINPFCYNKEENKIEAFLYSKDLYPKYYDLFAKHEYEGNGYCWEGHIIQILEKEKPELLEHLEFDSEAMSFCVYCEDGESAILLLNILVPIFNDLTKLSELIRNADRERIDD